MTMTWNRQAKRFRLYVNAVLKLTSYSNQANVDLCDTGKLHYKVGGEPELMFKGWISELVAFPQELKLTEVQKLKGRMWKKTLNNTKYATFNLIYLFSSVMNRLNRLVRSLA